MDRCSTHQQTGDSAEAFRSLTLDDRTVGYGDRYPRCEDPNLIVEDSNRACGIRHDPQPATHGFDITHFGSGQHGVDRFLSVLEAIDLDVIADYVRVFRDLGRGCQTTYPPHYLNVWVNREVLIACTSNPITGEGFSKHHHGERGQAGYIGVGGRKAATEQAVELLNERLVRTKGQRSGGLFI